MDPRFFRIRPGLWGLTAQRDLALDSLQIGEAASEEQQTAFDHTYYQGLALMIGKLRGYEVFAPKPDRSKPFLGKPLGAQVSVQQFPRFTYDSLCQRAQTIDVIWFHTREVGLFPNAYFEIEHTTDFNSALIKFTEFQDFRIRFYIVARKERQGEFQKRDSLPPPSTRFARGSSSWTTRCSCGFTSARCTLSRRGFSRSIRCRFLLHGATGSPALQSQALGSAYQGTEGRRCERGLMLLPP
jgi:hypothetical protein